MKRISQQPNAQKAHDCWLFVYFGGVVKLANTPDFQSGILPGFVGSTPTAATKGGQDDETATTTP
jgi:hypothetical protein